ncbi:MAG TPA: hypothetical protein VKV79_06745 [Terriglobia bacterium]|nr:hypothetical protein [Terriglobia bacterium]
MDVSAKNADPSQNAATPQAPLTAQRENDAIYQNGRLVGRVLEPEIDGGAKEIRFGEIYNSDNLLLPDECDFQRYRIVVRKVAFASKVEKDSLHKGRILRGVMAEILGFREQ